MALDKGRNGGRKRGRPVTLTPEQKLEGQRKRWRRKTAAKRKRDADAQWQRGTNFGYFVQLWVPHYNQLVEALVGGDYLDEADRDLAPRVDAAADEVFANIIKVSYDSWLWDRGRSFVVGAVGTVRVRMTQELAEKLADYECTYHRVSSDRLRWADERVEDARRAYSGAKAAAAREQRKPFCLRLPLREKKEEEYLNDIREAEADRDQLRRKFRTPEEFKEAFLQNRGELTRAAERYLSHFCDRYVPKQPWVACNCKMALPECDCPSRFRPPPGAPKPLAWPRGERPLVKRDLLSNRKPRWWGEKKYNDRGDDDPIIRSHDKSASVGMEGFHAGSKGVWKNNNAEYCPEQDNRASTRDWNKTASQGEKALQKPYDDLEGTPRSWSNPSDLEPDNEDGIKRIGKRVIEETVIERPTKKKGDD